MGSIALVIGTSSCMTGPRPTLGPTTSLAPVTDRSIADVIDALSTDPSAPFTVVYDITTKYGGLTSTAEVTYEPSEGTAVLIDTVLYLFPIGASEVTCTWSEESLEVRECSPGIDETRVSHLQLNSRVFKDAVIDRLRRDAQVTSGDGTPRQADIAERSALCVDIPVVDSNGAEQTKSYCAYSDIGLVASLDTADLTISAVFVDDVASVNLLDVGSDEDANG